MTATTDTKGAPRAFTILAAVNAALLLCILGVLYQHTRKRQPPPYPAYQYRIIALPDATIDADLQSLGQDRWRLVNARRATDGDGNYSYECIFIRTMAF